MSVHPTYFDLATPLNSKRKGGEKRGEEGYGRREGKSRKGEIGPMLLGAYAEMFIIIVIINVFV